MKMRNNDPLDLILQEDESDYRRISSRVDLADFVNFSLNGSAFPGTGQRAKTLVFSQFTRTAIWL